MKRTPNDIACVRERLDNRHWRRGRRSENAQTQSRIGIAGAAPVQRFGVARWVAAK